MDESFLVLNKSLNICGSRSNRGDDVPGIIKFVFVRPDADLLSSLAGSAQHVEDKIWLESRSDCVVAVLDLLDSPLLIHGAIWLIDKETSSLLPIGEIRNLNCAAIVNTNDLVVALAIWHESPFLVLQAIIGIEDELIFVLRIWVSVAIQCQAVVTCECNFIYLIGIAGKRIHCELSLISKLALTSKALIAKLLMTVTVAVTMAMTMTMTSFSPSLLALSLLSPSLLSLALSPPLLSDSLLSKTWLSESWLHDSRLHDSRLSPSLLALSLLSPSLLALPLLPPSLLALSLLPPSLLALPLPPTHRYFDKIINKILEYSKFKVDIQNKRAYAIFQKRQNFYNNSLTFSSFDEFSVLYPQSQSFCLLKKRVYRDFYIRIRSQQFKTLIEYFYYQLYI